MSARQRSLGFIGAIGSVVMVLGPTLDARAAPVNWSRARDGWVVWLPVRGTSTDPRLTLIPTERVAPFASASASSPRTTTRSTSRAPVSASASASAATVNAPVSLPPWWRYGSFGSPSPSPSPSPSSSPLGGFTLGAATRASSPSPALSPYPAAAPATASVGTVAPSPAPSPAPAPGYAARSSAPVTARQNTAPTPPAYNAFINFGSGPYPEASLMTTGGAQPWYNSPSVQSAFGGTPNAQQQAEFTNKVLQNIQRTFKLAGLDPKLTLDPSASASHTLSVVSNTSYPGNTSAIGITNVGANGFGFIDKLNYARSPDELALAVAHNVSHELMHAFGVGVHHDQAGTYLDSGTASWAMLTDPNATFSAAAAREIASELAQTQTSSTRLGAQGLEPAGAGPAEPHDHVAPAPVPEPASWASWSLAATLALTAARQRRRRRRRIAA